MKYLLYLIPLLFLWATPAGATPNLDATACSGHCPTAIFTGTSGTATGISSVGTSGCIVVSVGAENSGSNNSPTVSGVTGGSNVGSFTRRGSQVTGNSTGSFGAQSDDSEIWSAAFTAALSSNTVTVTMSASVDGASFTVSVVTGTFNNGCAWDSHAQATATAAWTSGVSPSIAQTTNQAHDLLFIFGVQGNDNAATSGTPSTFAGTGGTISGSSCEAGGARSICNGAFVEQVSTTQAAISDIAKMVNGGTSFSSQGYATVDALTSDNNSGGSSPPLRLLMGVGK